MSIIEAKTIITDAQIYAAIYHVLWKTRNAATGVDKASALIPWVQRYARDASAAEARTLAFELLVETVQRPDNPADLKRPLRAAFDMLALAEPNPTKDHEIEPGTKLSINKLRTMSQPEIKGRNPRENLSLRQQIATLNGNYGTDRSGLNASKRHRESITSAVVAEMEQLLAERYGPPPLEVQEGVLIADGRGPTASTQIQSSPSDSAQLSASTGAQTTEAHEARNRTVSRSWTRNRILLSVIGLLAGAGVIALALLYAQPDPASAALVRPPSSAGGLCSATTPLPVGWWPQRDIFANTTDIDHPVINSVRNNPDVGDERRFVTVRPSDDLDKGSHSISVQSGRKYTVRMYIRNDAATSSNAPDAIQSRVNVELSACTGRHVAIFGVVRSANARPIEVSDGVLLSSNVPFNLGIVSGSAKLLRSEMPGFVSLPLDLYTPRGVPLTSDPSRPGVLLPGFNAAVTVEFEVVIEGPGYTP